MCDFLCYLILSGVAMSQSPVEQAVSRMKTLQSARVDAVPSWASYDLNGEPNPTFFGRKVSCRCYTERDGSYFVEERSEFYSSQVWLSKSRLVYRYAEFPVDGETDDYVFIFSPPATDSSSPSLTSRPEQLLEEKGWYLGRVSAFDTQCVALLQAASNGRFVKDTYEGLVKRSAVHATYRNDGFDISVRSPPRMTIRYRFAGKLPTWKDSTDKILRGITSEKVRHHALDASFSYESVMETIVKEAQVKVKIELSELPNAARVHGYMLPTSKEIAVISAVSSNRGRSLEITMQIRNSELGNRKFECLESRFPGAWTADGKFKKDIYPAGFVSKIEELPHGVLVVTVEPAVKPPFPTTHFFHRPTKRELLIDGDLFDDTDFRKIIASLR